MSNLSALPKLLKLRSTNQIICSNIRLLGNYLSSNERQLIFREKYKNTPYIGVLQNSIDISHLIKQNSRWIYTPGNLCKYAGDDEGKNSGIDKFRADQEKIERDYEEQERLKQGNAQEKDDQSKSESSEDHEKIQKLRTEILEASLKYIVTHGWSQEAIVRGAESINYPGVAHGMFPNGAIELIQYFYSKCNRELIEKLQQELNESDEQNAESDGKLMEKLSPRDFAIKAIRMRLEMIIPYKDTWPQALAIMTLPQNVPTSLAQLLTLVDDICYCAGDRSVDIGWYTRRIGIASIYKMVELFLLQDKSTDYQQTWTFLERRMDEGIQIQEFLNSSDQKTQRMARALGSAFQTARNVLGVNCDKR